MKILKKKIKKIFKTIKSKIKNKVRDLRHKRRQFFKKHGYKIGFIIIMLLAILVFISGKIFKEETVKFFEELLLDENWFFVAKIFFRIKNKYIIAMSALTILASVLQTKKMVSKAKKKSDKEKNKNIDCWYDVTEIILSLMEKPLNIAVIVVAVVKIINRFVKKGKKK